MNTDNFVSIGIFTILLGIVIPIVFRDFSIYILAVIAFLLISAFLLQRKNIFLLVLGTIVFGSFISYIGTQTQETAHLENKKEFKVIITKGAVSRSEVDVRYVATFQEDTDIKLLITLPFAPEHKVGDCITFKGTLQKPTSFDDFNYPRFLQKDDIYFTSKYPDIVEKYNCDLPIWISFTKQLAKLKDWFIKNIRDNSIEPEGSLASGIVLGGDSTLPVDLSENLRRAGTIHIAVLSGYNITLTADTTSKALSFLPPLIGGLFTIIVVILFTLVAGPEPPLIRATIMSVIIILARLTGREYMAGRALIAASLLMVLFNPLILIYDISFHLTFLASMGIIYFTPIVEKYLTKFQRIKKYKARKNILYEILVTTISTQLLLAPYLLYRFAEISVVSIFANMFTLIAIPSLMATTIIGGFIAGIPIISFIGELFILVASYISSYIIFIAEFFGNLPFATQKLDISLYVAVIWYLFYLYLFIKTPINEKSDWKHIAN